jgi:CubicO group peptidase (beta-lactamase class C family)
MSRTFECVLVVSIAGAMTSALAANSPKGETLSAKADAAIRQQMYDQKIPGVSLAVVRDGRIIKAAGYGLANLEVSAPVRPETIFEAGSITKQFTATAVMLLAEQGTIGLDDSITKYFPEAPMTSKAVTIRYLLTHTSGILDVYDSSDETQFTKGIVDFHRDYTEDELARAYLAQPLEFQPAPSGATAMQAMNYSVS